MTAPVFNAGLELRAAGDGSRRLFGSFPYNSLAVLDAGGNGRRPRKEKFAPGAFSWALDQSPEAREIHLLSGHSFDRPLASRKAGTLLFRDTRNALNFEAVLTPDILSTSWGSDFVAAFAAGLVGGISPGFRVAPIEGAEETTDEEPSLGKALIRTLFAVVLFEMSLVTRPAYDETELNVRSWDALKTEPIPLPEKSALKPALNRWRL